MVRNSYIAEIENEYKKIDEKWLRLHFKTAVGLVAFGVAVECLLGTALFRSGLVQSGLERYILKYLITPLVCNLLCIIATYLTLRSPNITQRVKIYTVSLMFVIHCFVYFTVHCIFTAFFLIFTVPVLLTVVYGDFKLTTITALFSVFAYAISDVFITWDPVKPEVFADYVGVINFAASIFVLMAFYVACMVVILFVREKNTAGIQKEMERLQLQEKLMTDELTSISNRTAFTNEVEEIFNDRYDGHYILVMIDLDNFKMLNDKFGHNRGDQYLKIFAGILKANCAGGIPFRFGGDEFCILFKTQMMEEVVTICKKIQRDLNKQISAAAIDIPLSASFGIANYNNETKISEFLNKADFALYRSKETKNAIHVYDDKQYSH